MKIFSFGWLKKMRSIKSEYENNGNISEINTYSNLRLVSFDSSSFKPNERYFEMIFLNNSYFQTL